MLYWMYRFNGLVTECVDSMARSIKKWQTHVCKYKGMLTQAGF